MDESDSDEEHVQKKMSFLSMKVLNITETGGIIF